VAVRTAASVQVIGWPGLAVGVRALPAESGGQARVGQPLGILTVHDGTGDAITELRAAAALPAPSLWWRLTRVS
jgi:hypothetical protein